LHQHSQALIDHPWYTALREVQQFMTEQTEHDWFEAAWACREETIYSSTFGDIGSGIYTLDAELFTGQFRQTSVDPRWLTHGVFESKPSPARASWLYVSSGLSNAWEVDSPKAEEPSGLGCEFILECESKSQWALLLLRRMVAFQILLSVGRFEGKGVLQAWDRVPLRAPIDGMTSRLDWVLLTPAPNFSGRQSLLSGHFSFLEFIGITDDEADFGRNNGGDKLLALLTREGAAPLTDPNRESVLHRTAR
jgi:hypothetical protein